MIYGLLYDPSVFNSTSASFDNFTSWQSLYTSCSVPAVTIFSCPYPVILVVKNAKEYPTTLNNKTTTIPINIFL